ncbi:disulfide bond formation protein DsbC [Pseudoxanthomonas broegbernensis]|uniref:Thiol:disulfide interchange protein n=1 Tax=Pseudoxanthomonas broegbernensis TaxID=83619 RepID=A0A7V8K789_9GAMM|nr:thioredoxin fold domain-containing protein [Pseudoxanthomonas broegbernensis]KAF1686585.1 disulfide bond formation protein DsbC [Pseudoxanthomonas broegbernensis]MBB6063667.1 thiol:disulfide interchange protein DsbC [Pseudoxanthomonas broegbernensis]
MYRILATALLGAFSLGACAQPAPPAGGASPAAKPAAAGSAEQHARQALAQLVPGAQPDYIGDAPFAGFREVLLSGQVLYVSDDGRFLMQSQPFDIQARRPAASPGLMAFRRQALEGVPEQERIVFSPPNPKYTISVFTDVECGYCRRMHQEIAEYNRLGIAVEYLAFPRMGMGSDDFRDMVSVWCSADRKRALTQAKAGTRVPGKQCTSPVAMHYALGQRIGVTGTPAVFAQDGSQLGGYMPPQQMIQALERMSAEAGGAR